MHCSEKHERYFHYFFVFICIDYKYTEVMICTDMCHSYVLWLLSGLAHERRFSNYQIFLTFLSQVTVKLELSSLKSIYGNIKYWEFIFRYLYLYIEFIYIYIYNSTT